MIELIIDDNRDTEAYELLDAIGIFITKDDICSNVFRVDTSDQLLVEEVLTEHGFLYQWDTGEDE